MKIPSHLKARVKALFEQMDQAYNNAAEQSGFACDGCRENCCMTRFYHHTLLEYLYLHEAMSRLPPARQEQIKRRAAAVVQQMAAADGEASAVRVMCPLNREGRCVLYAHRPMICRLHGIPHALHRPDGQELTGPGCDDFYRQCGSAAHKRLDRTPLYRAMAALERELRRQLGVNDKIKMTVAEMIDHFAF